jgi:hypothetical protein
MSKYLITILLCSATALSICQEKRNYTAVRTYQIPKIDGKPFESVWESAEVGNNFIMLQPENGIAESLQQKTVVKIMYDDNAVYVAGYLYDNEASKISSQFSQRDQINVQADIFSFWINTYTNQIDQTRFYITAAGAMADSKSTNGEEDFGYNVIFEAKSSSDDNGWYIEMVIPYQALRFSKENIQNWSFNAYRKINRLNQSFTYNFINIKQGNEAQYDANLLGILKINPPFRLSLFPYSNLQSVVFKNTTETKMNAGLDIKYGLSEAFTLDATLIPDFGQVAFDDIKLNLSPFEQVFDERRPFFTEGTDLFSKGDLFFSRRIGQQPSGFNIINNQITENELVKSNPTQTQLINAIKVTGRSKSKIGIGFLNAITKEMYATIVDTLNLKERKIVTEPLTNYNMMVIDKQYGANSSFYFSNANTFRSGSFTDANVTAIGINHFDKKNIYNYGANLKMSNRFLNDSKSSGVAYSARWQKVEGTWRFGISHNYIEKSYNPNDLGLQFENNINTTYIFGSYNQFTPKGKFNNYAINYNIFHSRTNQPNTNNFTQFSLNPNFQTKKLWQGGGFVTAFTQEYDFFESRISLVPVLYKPKIVYGSYITTDTRKKISLFANINAENRINDAEDRIDFTLSPSFRVTERFFIRYRWFWQKRQNRLSFVTINNEQAIFSLRDTRTTENSIETVYNFDNTKAVNLRLRNFWSNANFSKQYRYLQSEGSTAEYSQPNNFNPNADFNIWNLDCSFEWQFAPASSLLFFYRNNLSSFKNDGQLSYFKSLNGLFQDSFTHTFSVRLSYFFDVNKILK